jgi:hypothetical protein
MEDHVRKLMLKASSKPPVIEFDHSVGAWYLRFRNAKIVKTISEDRPGFIAAIDLDKNNEVVGVELIGPMNFTISWLRKASPVDVSKVDFERAKWVPASSRDFVPA